VSIEFLRHNVDIVERNILDRVVAEVRRTEDGLYNNDLSDAEVIRQIGRITEADYVLIGDAFAIDPATVRDELQKAGQNPDRLPRALKRYIADLPGPALIKTFIEKLQSNRISLP
jgi:hypothetical protein